LSEKSSGFIPLQQFRYSLEIVYCKSFCPTANWQIIFVAIRHHLNSAQNKSGHTKTLAIRWVRLGLQMTPSLFRPLRFLLDARAARMSSVEESRKWSLHAERQVQYRKRYKENLESRDNTLEKEVSKWEAIARELQVFLDSFFFFHITSAFFADIRTCTFHCSCPLF
jgi:hypothetical protein